MIKTALVAFVSVQHFLFLILEAFLWTKPIGRKIFRLSQEDADKTKAMGQNQGLYNGFLAAGLAWSLLHPQETTALELQVFFLSCVVLAGVIGAMTVSWRILVIQSLPALLALLLIWL
ncbi:MAG: DUF1304 domain-containing protein [Bdellovibrionaceae bacterium]|nr:DUF1304 domain-containing protein [Bdellovibrionales bacterium]MCB9083266.1 DUF1304 domain-containing protein [Pseudobdellovibrionaceae bacterium]